MEKEFMKEYEGIKEDESEGIKIKGNLLYIGDFLFELPRYGYLTQMWSDDMWWPVKCYNEATFESEIRKMKPLYVIHEGKLYKKIVDDVENND